MLNAPLRREHRPYLEVEALSPVQHGLAEHPRSQWIRFERWTCLYFQFALPEQVVTAASPELARFLDDRTSRIGDQIGDRVRCYDLQCQRGDCRS